jgi:hypothetical protein
MGQNIKFENLKGGCHIRNLGVGGRIILKQVLNRILQYGLDSFHTGKGRVQW